MKIVAVDNFDCGTTSDRLVAENIGNENEAGCMVEGLNRRYSGAKALWFFEVKPDDYKLFVADPNV